MFSNDHDISVLNDLIATTIDSADGYTAAAKEAESGRYAGLFTARANERRTAATALQAEVVRIGGKAEDDGTVLAAAHRVFVNLRHAIAGGDVAVVDEVERGEDHIKAKYETALKDSDLSPAALSVIRDSYVSVKSGHDQMRDLKKDLHQTR